jgi:hypothetical protein
MLLHLPGDNIYNTSITYWSALGNLSVLHPRFNQTKHCDPHFVTTFLRLSQVICHFIL